MINLLAEGRAYHEIRDFVERFEDMQYEFYKCDDLHNLLKAYRYTQSKLFSSDHKISLYPTQLVILARYYFFHYRDDSKPEEHPEIRSEEEVRSLLCKWLTTLREKLQENRGQYAAWDTFDQFSSPWFQMPLHSNMMPLDVILQEARRAGRLDQDDFIYYPDPTGLPVLKKHGEKEAEWKIEKYQLAGTLTADEKKDAINVFWEAQLDALTGSQYEEKRNEDKRKKEAEKKEPSKKEEYRKLTADKIDRLTCSREIHAVFMLSVWYAQQFRMHRKRMADLGLADQEEEAFCAPVEADRIGRAHKEFYESLDKKLLSYREMFKKFPVTFGSESNSMLLVTYADPEAYVSRLKNNTAAKKKTPQRITLPAWNDLDNGYRNWDSDEYYGISVKFFIDVLEMFKFDQTGTRYKLTKAVSADEIRETLKEFYAGTGKMLYAIWDKAVKAEAKVPGKGTELMQKAMQTGDLTEEERICLQNYLKTYFKLEIGQTALDNGVTNATAGKHIEKITDSGTVGKTLQSAVEYLSKYMITHCWDEKKDRDKYESVKGGICRRMREKFIVEQEPYKALAEIIARTYTWAMLLLDDWNSAGSPDGTYIFWNRPRHLNIPEARLKEEKEFRDELIRSAAEKNTKQVNQSR